MSYFNTFTTLAANGSTAAFTLEGYVNLLSIFLGAATWGGGTLILQASPDGGTTWIAVPGASWTSGSANTKLTDLTIYGSVFRFTLSGATTPSISISARASRVRNDATEVFAFAADGDSAVFALERAPASFGWLAKGTWGSGTLTLKCSPDAGTTWFAVDTATANALKEVTGNKDSLFKFTLSGSTNPALVVIVYP